MSTEITFILLDLQDKATMRDRLFANQGPNFLDILVMAQRIANGDQTRFADHRMVLRTLAAIAAASILDHEGREALAIRFEAVELDDPKHMQNLANNINYCHAVDRIQMRISLGSEPQFGDEADFQNRVHQEMQNPK